MDSTHTIGLLLVGLSAFFLATHWQQWRDPELQRDNSPRARDYHVRTFRRRTVASSLVGVIGVSLMAFETVPQAPLSITAYLLSLVLMTCWILWLALVDLFAGRRFRDEQQLDQLAAKLRRAEIESSASESKDS